MTGFKNLFKSFRRPEAEDTGEYKDVHNRLMARYPEGMVCPKGLTGQPLTF